MRFSTSVVLGGTTATGMVVPDAVVDALGAGRRPAVVVTVGGHSYRTTVASRGGRFLVPLSAENRVAAGVAAGSLPRTAGSGCAGWRTPRTPRPGRPA